jgi:hypothetical protein
MLIKAEPWSIDVAADGIRLRHGCFNELLSWHDVQDLRVLMSGAPMEIHPREYRRSFGPARVMWQRLDGGARLDVDDESVRLPPEDTELLRVLLDAVEEHRPCEVAS